MMVIKRVLVAGSAVIWLRSTYHLHKVQSHYNNADVHRNRYSRQVRSEWLLESRFCNLASVQAFTSCRCDVLSTCIFLRM
ncbi:hypothetical protein K491DRAFT_891 [Lophiostoma macrostomum CBS 122681]|uniref:Uncharacterized protein n=1 Tax=Lophiostoma macrostomum CBS 122681 TaxID=1314788 RepID=A0A6A6TVU0_9PLEO|nr:hypothetical protein K491DRAFT_891 [Lophiostoma macrostomum CBS 122681]